MKKVSIIIPVYNVAPYVTKCMESITMQTLSDIEVIIVDDHGTDDSMEIVRRFAAASSRDDIRYVFAQTPQNSGPAAARNIGISLAQGEYIAFLDADDWIEPNMMESLYNGALRYKADISSSAATLDFDDGSHRMMYNPYIGSGEMTEKARRYILRHYVSNFTTMIFLRSWLQEHNISFPHSNSGEDSSFMGQCYLVCRSIAQINEPLYHYRIHSDSISHRKHVYRGSQKRIAFQALLDFARSKGLLSKYRCTLYWVYIKKALIVPVLEKI